MNPTLVRHLVYPAHETLRRRGTFARLREYEQMQWWPAERIRSRQEERLAHLLRHAAENTTFYRERFQQAGIEWPPRDPRTALSALPLLDKAIIRANRSRMCWLAAPGGLIESATGGSTGEPLRFCFDRRRQACDKASRMRTHRWFGVEVGEPEVYLWGAPAECNAQDRIKNLRDRFTNEMLLSAFDLTPGRMDTYIGQIEKFNPRCLFGYPSSLAILSQHALRSGRRPFTANLAAVFATGELLDEANRSVIRDCWGVPVADGYGSREAGFIAHECPAGQVHVMDESVIVEIVGLNGEVVPNGSTGEIVITHLEAYGMPMIRYRTGDVGRLIDGACPCGRGLSLVEIVGGRITDHLLRRDGTMMHGLSLIYVLREIAAIRQFQIRQRGDLSIEILVVAEDDASGSLTEYDHRRIHNGVRRQMGEGVPITIREVEQIKPASSGKHRCVVREPATCGNAQ